MGVRISWLMLARKSDLALVAATASSLAARRSASACLRSVMSLVVLRRYCGFPAVSLMTEKVPSAMTVRPSRRMKCCSHSS